MEEEKRRRGHSAEEPQPTLLVSRWGWPFTGVPGDEMVQHFTPMGIIDWRQGTSEEGMMQANLGTGEIQHHCQKRASWNEYVCAWS